MIKGGRNSPPKKTKMMKTSNGLEFRVLCASEIGRFNGYDRSVAECHIANCGRIIVDNLYGQPIDNEFDLEEIYNLLKN